MINHTKSSLLMTTAMASLFVGVAWVNTAAAAEATVSPHKNALFYNSENQLTQDPASKGNVSYKQNGDQLEIQANGWSNAQWGAYLNINPNASTFVQAADINNSKFTNNKSKAAGGAMSLWHDGTSGKASQQDQVLNSYFGNNSAAQGGAAALLTVNAFNEGSEGKTLFDNDVFEGNHASSQGGALYVEHNDAAVKNSRFENNTSDDQGGAVYVKNQSSDNGTLTVDNTVFKNNHAKGMGGAILNTIGATGSDTSDGVIITNSLFEGNTSGAQGGAIMNSGTAGNSGDLHLTNTSFVNNTSYKGGGGAIYSSGDVSVKGGLFKGNVAQGSNGGAVFAAAGSDLKHKLTIDGAAFDGNQAIGETTGAGGAISTAVDTTIKDSTFTNNFATNNGGAVAIAKQGAKKLHFEGNNVFKNNATLEGKNDIDIGEGATAWLDKGASLTLDGGISGQGKLTLENGSILNVKDTTKIENLVDGYGAIQVVVTDNTMNNEENKDHQLKLVDKEGIFTSQGLTSNTASSSGVSTSYVENMFDPDANNLYRFEENPSSKVYGTKDATYTVSERSAGEVAGRLGVTEAEATTLLAVSSSKTGSGRADFDDMQDTLRHQAQYGKNSALLSRAADALVADAAPVVRVRETALQNTLFDTATDALDNSFTNAAVAKEGNLIDQVKVWVKGLFNYADKDGTSKSHGFDVNTYGVAFGIDKTIGDGKIGLGYAYSESDIDGYTRDTDVDTHSLFLYGKYKPADWYVNAVASYSFSNYKEKKSVLGYGAKAKYDVDTFGLQSMIGYDLNTHGFGITPEAGLRYMHIAKDGYTDDLGTTAQDKDSNVLTGVAGVKVTKNFAAAKGINIRPEVRGALTYDLTSDSNNTAVSLANGAAIRVNGEELNRFGVELGAKVAADICTNWEVAAGYEARIRKDYVDHTGLLSVKYKF